MTVINGYAMLLSTFLHFGIFYVIARKKRRTSHDILIANAYANNLLYIATIFTFIFMMFLESPLLLYIDYLILLILYASHVTSALQIILVAQLYLAICHPLKLRVWVTKKKTWHTIGITYIVVISLYVTLTICVRQELASIMELGLASTAILVFMFVMVLVGYVKIFMVFVRHVRTKNNDNELPVRIRNSKNLLITIGLTLVINVVCYTPAFTFYLGANWFDEDTAHAMIWLEQILTPSLLLYIC